MKILIVDEGADMGAGTSEVLENLGHIVKERASAQDGLDALMEEPFHLLLLGLREVNGKTMALIEEFVARSPRLEVVVCSPSSSVREELEARRKGAAGFLPAPVSRRSVERLVQRMEEARRTAHRLAELEDRLERDAPPVRFETDDPRMREVLETVAAVATTPTTVLLLGESGTGKSLLARAIHEASGRRHQPFVTISCPSLSRELLESELFGHVRGAFTGAVRDKFGKVALADGGTLFLDEIADLPLELQPKLLRLLQEREYERLGETRTRKCDIRIIAATNDNLLEAVGEGRFREDLYYRLNVVPITAPPLRERPRDLERIASECVGFYSKRFQRQVRGFHPRALHALKVYEWPGNLRELDNAIERAVILAKGDFIDLPDLPSALGSDGLSEEAPVARMISLAELEKAHIRFVTERIETLEEAARVLGIDKSTLFRKRRRYGIG